MHFSSVIYEALFKSCARNNLLVCLCAFVCVFVCFWVIFFFYGTFELHGHILSVWVLLGG